MFITAPIFLTEQNVTGLKTAAPTALWPAAALSPACASPCGAKGVDGAAYKMDNPLVSAAPDGIQFVNGTPVFSNGTGDNFTGWVWNDRDRYYVVDNAIVTGWQYIDGYKYYFEGDGILVIDLEPLLKLSGQFKIKINKADELLTILYSRW